MMSRLLSEQIIKLLSQKQREEMFAAFKKKYAGHPSEKQLIAEMRNRLGIQDGI